MPREVQDKENVIWSCIEAYAGLKTDDEAKPEIAKTNGEKVEVICTPSGGAQTVRLELESDWETALSDEDLLGKIESNRET